jgi:hypothetical protein
VTQKRLSAAAITTTRPVTTARTAAVWKQNSSTPAMWTGSRAAAGLRPILAAREVTPAVGIAAGRVLRRWYHTKSLIKQVTVRRIERATGRVYHRRSRRRKCLFSHNRGFATVNDGLLFLPNWPATSLAPRRRKPTQQLTIRNRQGSLVHGGPAPGLPAPLLFLSSLVVPRSRKLYDIF